MNVTLGEESVKKLNTEFGKDHTYFVKCDVTKMSDFETAMKTVMTLFKTIDILINNAGVMNDSEWEKEIQINMVSFIDF